MSPKNIVGKPRLAFFQHFANAADGGESGFKCGLQAQIDGVVGLAEILPTLGVAHNPVSDAEGQQHGSRNFAGECAHFFPMQVLGADRNIRSPCCFQGSSEVNVGWANHDFIALVT